MNVKKLAPWNWFKKEENLSGHDVPVKQPEGKQNLDEFSPDLWNGFNDDFNRLINHFFNGFEVSAFRPWSGRGEQIASNVLKPSLDLSATGKSYIIAMEIPGVSSEDINIELDRNTLIIRGEKRQDNEEKNKNYYRMERSYGAFQRTLSLPRDADQSKVNARFKKGVLTITLPRVKTDNKKTRQIDIKYAA